MYLNTYNKLIANLTSDGQQVVDEILALMKNNNDLKIAIEGHTDNASAADRNKKLSTDRAPSSASISLVL